MTSLSLPCHCFPCPRRTFDVASRTRRQRYLPGRTRRSYVKLARPGTLRLFFLGFDVRTPNNSCTSAQSEKIEVVVYRIRDRTTQGIQKVTYRCTCAWEDNRFAVRPTHFTFDIDRCRSSAERLEKRRAFLRKQRLAENLLAGVAGGRKKAAHK